MFDNVLSKAEIEVGALSEENYKEFLKTNTKDNLDKIVIGILNEMDSPINFLLSMVKNLYGKNIFDTSKIEKLYTPNLFPTICEIRIRPENDYYIKLGKPVPKPDNPNGYDATGLEISFNVLRGFSIPNKTVFPCLYIHFSIWGAEEREAFGKFLKNYYRIIELLLNELNVDFFTSCVFERLDKLKTKNSFKRLSTYYQANDDEENTFSFERIFTYGESYDDIIKLFLVFAALYDSCLAYLNKRKDIDKIINYYQKVKTV